MGDAYSRRKGARACTARCTWRRHESCSGRGLTLSPLNSSAATCSRAAGCAYVIPRARRSSSRRSERSHGLSTPCTAAPTRARSRGEAHRAREAFARIVAGRDPAPGQQPPKSRRAGLGPHPHRPVPGGLWIGDRPGAIDGTGSGGRAFSEHSWAPESELHHERGELPMTRPPPGGGGRDTRPARGVRPGVPLEAVSERAQVHW
jgi:hypothetical protein